MVTAPVMLARPELPLLHRSRQVPASHQPFDMAGDISHRIIANYRVSPAALSAFDIAPLEWDLYRGAAFLSVCLLRYTRLGPTWWPSSLAHRGSCDALFRLAVCTPGSGDPLRGFLSLLNLNSSRLLASAGRYMAPHKFAYSPVRLRANGGPLVVSAPGISFAAEQSSKSYSPPATSCFASLHDAETFLLDLAGNLSLSSRGDVRLQPISHSPWESAFLSHTVLHFDLLQPWVDAGLLEFDSVLYMSNLSQVWRRTRPVEVFPAGPCAQRGTR